MRAVALLAVALNGVLLWAWRDAESRRRELLEIRSELERVSDSTRQAAERGRDLEALLESASERLPSRELDIDVLRDLLVDTERGLGIDRLSLEFRPASSRSAAASGGSIHANLEGTFAAVYEYVARVETLRLPLSAEDLSLRPAGEGGRMRLAIRWSAEWSTTGSGPRDLKPREIMELGDWLAREPPPVPGRDPFVPMEALASLEEPRGVDPFEGAPPSPSAPDEAVEPVSTSVPRLMGYVLARPELEADASRRVLAALRFQGQLHLVQVGDVVGSFRVEQIEPRESVLLVHEGTGERVTLFLP